MQAFSALLWLYKQQYTSPVHLFLYIHIKNHLRKQDLFLNIKPGSSSPNLEATDQLKSKVFQISNSRACSNLSLCSFPGNQVSNF